RAEQFKERDLTFGAFEHYGIGLGVQRHGRKNEEAQEESSDGRHRSAWLLFNGPFQAMRWFEWARGHDAVSAMHDIRKKCIESRSDDDTSRTKRVPSKGGGPRLP